MGVIQIITDFFERLFAGDRANKKAVEKIFRQGPVRGNVRKNAARGIGLFPSTKMGRGIFWESQLELMAIRWLEVLGSVKRYMEQPFTVEYILDGKTHKYTPDLIVEYFDGRIEVWEIKPEKFLNKGHLQALKKAAEATFAEYGLAFRVISEPDLPKGAESFNVGLLLRYRMTTLNDKYGLLQQIIGQEITIRELMGGFLGAEFSFAEIIVMIGRGYLLVNMDEQISKDSVVMASAEMFETSADGAQ